MTDPKSLIDGDRIALSEGRFRQFLQMVGGFHDALLDTSWKVGDTWILEIRHVYFPSEQRYGAFGTDGCELHLAGCNVPEESVREAQDREIFELELAGDQAGIVFSFDGMEITGITIAPERSFIQWRFRPG